ncbi:outer membrane protein assembly factor BamE [Accumulibacter sp.]|uniref:outer membrane protein assembly factor BamE domain-containing protein n=1 Tax=Accumulibacter sp. TaxID=2053492 RepID=UPI0025F5D035|nr:outer membrane protein assembly factor BamE [Accumulibacter sp.]MCM8613900.1 outer membrane protein assembly factor BamE [Accumulibacter sp.]MCM8637713.1 outer membrane protein assembly factor BamE [Accumulibacter sp.]MCM8641073.1 outer membrane protein assembly factor BamE [Accumulibacter sp.]
MFRIASAAIFGGTLLLATLAACDADRLSRLRPGATTASEVKDVMGQPTLEWREADGSRVWEYPRTPQGIVNYLVLIGPDGVLREVQQVLTEENFARVAAGMTQDQVRRLLGRPAHETYFPLKRETIWDWKTKVDAGMEWYFNVHFDSDGRVTGTSSNYVPKG